MMISDSGKKLMEAMKVFSESLRYLKDHALSMISNHTNGRTFSASDVTWVLTVPAIWEPAAKQFMREAAIQVSLPPHPTYYFHTTIQTTALPLLEV